MKTKTNGVVKYSLADHIWIILKENIDNGNPFLGLYDLSLLLMNRINTIPNDKYYKKQIQYKTIKATMGMVRNLANANNMTIVAERKTTNDAGKSLGGWIVIGWRIADERDEDYIRKEIEIRNTQETGLRTSRERIQGKLPPGDKQEAIEE
jgi:hypothetical protein